MILKVYKHLFSQLSYSSQNGKKPFADLHWFMDHTSRSTALPSYLYSPLNSNYRVKFKLQYSIEGLSWSGFCFPLLSHILPFLQPALLLSFPSTCLHAPKMPCLSQPPSTFRLCHPSLFSSWPISASLPRHSSIVPSSLKPFLNLLPILSHNFLVTLIDLITLLCNYW